MLAGSMSGPKRFASALALLGPLTACGESGGTQCTCGDPGVVVDLPAQRAAAVSGVALSGTGCPNVTPTCTQPLAQGCAQFEFRGTAVGQCDVDVQFSSGPADFNVEIAFRSLPCCPGVYAYPAGAATVDVPELQGDAGYAE
jgi:hypothetical protein